MMVAFQLGKTEQEIGGWSLQDLVRWMAFFRLKARYEQEAIDRAKRGFTAQYSGSVETLTD